MNNFSDPLQELNWKEKQMEVQPVLPVIKPDLVADVSTNLGYRCGTPKITKACRHIWEGSYTSNQSKSAQNREEMTSVTLLENVIEQPRLYQQTPSKNI